MRIFDRDRLICECIFHENEMERETYSKAIRCYVADTRKDIRVRRRHHQRRPKMDALSLKDVMESIDRFLRPVWDAVIGEDGLLGWWSCKEACWQP